VSRAGTVRYFYRVTRRTDEAGWQYEVARAVNGDALVILCRGFAGRRLWAKERALDVIATHRENDFSTWTEVTA
jgi:hypothetical protein